MIATILLQVASAFFAVACAWLNRVPLRKMIDFGASLSEEKEFHRANAIVKIVFSVTVAACTSKFISFFLTVSLIQWLVFDIALNLFTAKKWNYIGETSSIDKALSKVGGKQSEAIKSVLVVFVIIGINILFL